MFENIENQGEGGWICFLDEPYKGSNIAYAGDFIGGVPDSVTGAEVYWLE